MRQVRTIPEQKKKMEMDGGTATVLIVTVALLIAPFLVDLRRRRRNGRALLRILQDAASANGYILHQYEVHADIALGLDDRNKRLFVLRRRKDGTVPQEVDLAQVQACQVRKTGRDGKQVQADDRIATVELSLSAKAGGNIPVVLYSEEHGAHMDGELLLAEKWATLVNGTIRG